jgi:hypothetical protein
MVSARHWRVYYRSAAFWALFVLSGRKLRQPMSARKLADWAGEVAGVPSWLFAESYDAVGDLAETIALLLPEGGSLSVERERSLQWWVQERLLPLRTADEAEQRAVLTQAWSVLDSRGRFVLNKLITGEMRGGAIRGLKARQVPALLPPRSVSGWSTGRLGDRGAGGPLYSNTAARLAEHMTAPGHGHGIGVDPAFEHQRMLLQAERKMTAFSVCWSACIGESPFLEDQ